MEKQKNVPKLRFPGFEGEWERKKLGEVTSRIMYGMNAPSMPFDGKNKYLRITDIDETSRTFTPNPLTSPEGNIEDKYKLKEGDIVFTRTGASVGKSYLYNIKDGNLFFAGFLIKFSIVKANPYFIFSQTLREIYNKWVKRMSMRSGQPGINAEEYKELEVGLPSVNEQKRIASFFTVLDKKIAELIQKKDLLEQYKKGVMQKLFSQELRFKDDGNEFPEWEKKRLGDLCKMQAGKYINAEEISSVKSINTFPCYGGNGLRGYVKKFNQIGKYSLIGRQGAHCGNVTLVDGKFFATEHAVVVTIKEGLDTDWIFYLLNYANLNQHSTGLAQPGLSVQNLEKVSVIVSKSLQEQIKVSTFLSAIDIKINRTEIQIQQTQQYKKGLLQNMFV